MHWLDWMKLFWKISESHWLLKPLEWVGNWMEDVGLERGWIRWRGREGEDETEGREYTMEQIAALMAGEEDA